MPTPRALVSSAAKLLLGLLVVLSPIVAPARVHAHPPGAGPATPGNDGPHTWANDGCSWVPDWGVAWGGGFYNFHHACVHHDGCYREHWTDKASCDSRFRDDMYASCDELHPRWWQRKANASCHSHADLYDAGVRRLGRPAYAAGSVEIRMM